MALDLTLLGATAVQAVAKLVNYTMNTSIDPNWIQVSGTGSPFLAPVTVSIQAVSTPDASGNAPKYNGGATVTYNRAGFQKAFVGLGLKVKLQPPYTVGSVVTAIQQQYGIILEEADLIQPFSQALTPDGNNNVALKPGLNSLRFYIDYSTFNLVVNLDSTVQTELDRLISMTQMADMAVLNAANTPQGNAYGDTTPINETPA